MKNKTISFVEAVNLSLIASMKKNKNQFGILVCGSGIGMDMTANRHKNIRAALCYNSKSTKLSRLHNNANVMAIGARLTKKKQALKYVNIFFNTNFFFKLLIFL